MDGAPARSASVYRLITPTDNSGEPMITIPRNHTKRVTAVFDAVTSCTVFRLDNDFVGVPCDAKYAREALSSNHNARLIAREGARYTIRVHSNLWYELATTPADPEPLGTGGAQVQRRTAMPLPHDARDLQRQPNGVHTPSGYLIALLHVFEGGTYSEHTSVYGLFEDNYEDCIAQLTRDFPDGRWEEGSNEFVVEDWRRSIRLYPVSCPTCACGHAWISHDPVTGECECSAPDPSLGPCPCGRDMEHHREEKAKQARHALKRLVAGRRSTQSVSAP